MKLPAEITVRQGNIVRQADCDAIVNSANRQLRPGSGVCGAIHAAAGPELETFCRPLAPLALGEAVVTPGFRLSNRFVIHVLSPQYLWDPEPAQHLDLALRNVLRLADEQGLERIAIPGLSMGVYAYPPGEAVPILVRAAFEMRPTLVHVREIRFIVMDPSIQMLFENRISEQETQEALATSAKQDNSSRIITPELIQAIRNNYRLSWTGIHGVGHWGRVRRNGLRIATLNGARTDVVELFSFLHDSCRQNEQRDPEHGARAVDFARRLRGHEVVIDDNGFELLCEAMAGHSNGLMDADVTIQTCWDADRLDLNRVGRVPDPDRLCTDAGRSLLEQMNRASEARDG